MNKYVTKAIKGNHLHKINEEISLQYSRGLWKWPLESNLVS